MVAILAKGWERVRPSLTLYPILSSLAIDPALTEDLGYA
jgi:hypothetical protein